MELLVGFRFSRSEGCRASGLVLPFLVSMASALRAAAEAAVLAAYARQHGDVKLHLAVVAKMTAYHAGRGEALTVAIRFCSLIQVPARTRPDPLSVRFTLGLGFRPPCFVY